VTALCEGSETKPNCLSDFEILVYKMSTLQERLFQDQICPKIFGNIEVIKFYFSGGRFVVADTDPLAVCFTDVNKKQYKFLHAHYNSDFAKLFSFIKLLTRCVHTRAHTLRTHARTLHYTTLYTHIRTLSTDYRELILVEVKSRE